MSVKSDGNWNVLDSQAGTATVPVTYKFPGSNNKISSSGILIYIIYFERPKYAALKYVKLRLSKNFSRKKSLRNKKI